MRRDLHPLFLIAACAMLAGACGDGGDAGPGVIGDDAGAGGGDLAAMAMPGPSDLAVSQNAPPDLTGVAPPDLTGVAPADLAGSPPPPDLAMAPGPADLAGGCIEIWKCAPWDTGTGTPASSNMATRACIDANKCGTTNRKPITTVKLPALDLNYFRCKVEPVLDQKCGMTACHGSETDRTLRVYSRGRLREAQSMITNGGACGGSMTGAACLGSNSCPCNGPHSNVEWQRNFDAARGFALDAAGAALANMDTSDLIQQPMVGGKSHAGIHLFRGADAEHAALLGWLAGGTLQSCNFGSN